MHLDQDALYRAMKKQELSTRRLGELAGCSGQMIAHLVNGRRTCSPRLAQDIANALGLALADIVRSKRPNRVRGGASA